MVNNISVMNRIKHFYKRNTLIIKILFSYFIIGFVFLTIFSFVLIRTYSNKSLTEANETSEKMIAQSYYTADILLTNTYYNYYQLFANNTDKDISNALYAKELDQFFMADVSKKLNQYVMTNPLIRSIYIYNTKADKIMYRLSQEGGGVQSKVEFYDQDIVKRLEEVDSRIINTYFTRKVSYSINNKSVNDNLISLVFASISGDKKVEAAIVVNLDQKVLQRMVTNGGTGDLNQVFIIYENGDIITHSDSSIINKNLSDESYVKTILQAESKKGYFTDKINGKDSLVTYEKAERLRWIFVGVGEYNKLLSSSVSMQKIIIILTIIFIVMGLIVAAFFASSIYNPFQSLLKDIQKRYKNQKNNQSKKQSLDVYDYLKYTFNDLADDVDKYKLDSYQLLDQKKKNVLKRIINGDLYNEAMDKEYFSEFEIKFQYNYFLVVVIKIDAETDFVSAKRLSQANLIKFAVLNIACELINSVQLKAEGIDNGNDLVSIILNLQDRKTDSLDEITNIMKKVQDSIESFLKFSITIGVGEIDEGIDSVNNSFKRALIASNYRIVFGKKSIIAYSDIADRNSDIHEYPYNIEKQIADSIKGLNIRKLEGSLDEFFNVIATFFSADEILMAATQLLVIVAKTTSSMNRAKDDHSFKNMFTKLQSFETLDEIKAYIYSFCSEIIQLAANNPEKNKKINIVNKIKEYVEKNYKDQNINTDLIAEQVELSCNYVRTIFKEITNVSLTDYITQCRMEEAQRLLGQTDYPIKKIAEIIGYPENSKHFYTIFKKYFGRTPDEYRSKLKVGE